jgi:hypothetical protein
MAVVIILFVLSTLFPGSTVGGLSDIDHVVLFMQVRIAIRLFSLNEV